MKSDSISAIKEKRHVLGVSVSLSERETHWRTFLKSLVERGLHSVQLITSDAHSGLKAAKQAVFQNVASCERLIRALLMEIDKKWQQGKIYLIMDEK